MCTTLGYVDHGQPLQSTWFDIDQSWIPWNIGKNMGPLGHHFTIQEIIPKMAQLICSFFAPKVLEPIPSRLRLLASQGCETEPTSKSWFLGTQNCRDSFFKKNGTPTISMSYMSYPRLENWLISCVIPSFQASILNLWDRFRPPPPFPKELAKGSGFAWPGTATTSGSPRTRTPSRAKWVRNRSPNCSETHK